MEEKVTLTARPGYVYERKSDGAKGYTIVLSPGDSADNWKEVKENEKGETKEETF